MLVLGKCDKSMVSTPKEKMTQMQMVCKQHKWHGRRWRQIGRWGG